MKNLKLLAGLFTILAVFSGCGKGNAPLSSASPFADNQSKDITDTSSCVGVPVAGTTILGSWIASSKNPSIGTREDITVTVQRNSFSVTAMCTGFGTSNSVSVTVPSRVTGNAIVTLAADSKQTNVNPVCQIAVPQATLTYTLLGNCAVLSINSKTTTMVRSGL